ncbi:kinase-like protein, partial [Favolaschia claudopus]
MNLASSDVWVSASVSVKSYSEHFSVPRPAPPLDAVASSTINRHDPSPEANVTKTLSTFDPATLQYTLPSTEVTLDIALVLDVLNKTGPKITDSNRSSWQFTTQPDDYALTAYHEADYYDWLAWAVCRPAASAVNAVRDELYNLAHIPIPDDGYSRIDKVNKGTDWAATDLVQRWSKINVVSTPHEFKRDRALHVDRNNQSVLDFLYEHAKSGYRFRSKHPVPSSTLTGKAHNIISQIINEMIATNTCHALISSQERYALFRVTDSLQLAMSPVYNIRGSETQVRDLTELTLVIAMPVTLPAFPTSVFQPYEGVFRGGRIGRTKLVSTGSNRSFHLPWARFYGDVRSTSNDVAIVYGRLIFLFFASGTLIAKAAWGKSATQRLHREYDAYDVMHTLQGIAIPKIAGMFAAGDGKIKVLIMSYAGITLTGFSELNTCQKRMLFRRLVRVHKIGVQHNDFEPRNVTMSSSGPLIIDFDHASLDHVCPGAICQELLQVAQALGLKADEVEELHANAIAVAHVASYRALVTAAFAVVFVVLCYLYGLDSVVGDA